MDIDDLQEAAEQQRQELNKLCRIDDGWIRFAVTNSNEVDIELKRIANYQKVVWWTRHLAGKPWMTLSLLRHFIRLVCEHHHLEFKGSL